MKKAIIFGIVAVLSAGMAIAQDDVVMVGQMEDSAASEAQTSVEAALVSSHVWRGQVYNNDMVFQPQITVEQAGVSVNVWGNYDLGSNKDGVSSDFSEIDFSLAYTLPINVSEMALDIGIIGYHFPDNGDNSVTNNRSTAELFVKATVLSWQDNAVPVIPSVTLFGDIDEANGTYILIDLAVPYQVSDYVVVEGGLSAGYGNTSYNDYYWNKHLDGGWNDYNIYCNASYEITENMTVALNLTGTVLEGGVRDAANKEYEAKGKLWGGVNIAYDF